MPNPDEDDLLQVDQQLWVRREPSMSIRLIGLATALAGITIAIYLATALALGSHTRAHIQAEWQIRPEVPWAPVEGKGSASSWAATPRAQ